jgi:hypothetical protein
MIRHIVLWRLKSADAESIARIRGALQTQLGRVPGLLRVEVGRSFNTGRRAVDLALSCDFESREALAAYHRSPSTGSQTTSCDYHTPISMRTAKP